MILHAGSRTVRGSTSGDTAMAAMTATTARRELALVLGGGGVGGIAWEIGVLAGLAASGRDLTRVADYVVGTSAGAAVAAQLSGDPDWYELLERQANPLFQTPEARPPVTAVQELNTALADGMTMREWHRRVQRQALRWDADIVRERRTAIEARLPSHQWPKRHMAILAVEAARGAMVSFGPDSGIGLTDAVEASCAVPGLWPPVRIGDSCYVDGGVRTSTNADLAAGYKTVVILAPTPDPDLRQQTEELRFAGSLVVRIDPDAASIAAFGADPFDPASRTASSQAGYRQGCDAAATEVIASLSAT